MNNWVTASRPCRHRRREADRSLRQATDSAGCLTGCCRGFSGRNVIHAMNVFNPSFSLISEIWQSLIHSLFPRSNVTLHPSRCAPPRGLFITFIPLHFNPLISTRRPRSQVPEFPEVLAPPSRWSPTAIRRRSPFSHRPEPAERSAFQRRSVTFPSFLRPVKARAPVPQSGIGVPPSQARRTRHP